MKGGPQASLHTIIDFLHVIRHTQIFLIQLINMGRGGFKRSEGGAPPLPPPPPLFFLQSLVFLFCFASFFFCNDFEELQTLLFEVELIINNKPLTYVYPKTPNHLLFTRKLLYSSNTTLTVVRNLNVLSSTTNIKIIYKLPKN